LSAVADLLTMPDGSTFEFLERPDDPETGPLVMEFGLAPDCAAPPPHVHPGGQTESFESVEGSFALWVGKQWKRLDPGEKVEVPAGTRHTFRNKSGARALVRNVHSPAHSFERYLRRVHAVLSAAGPTSVTSPRIMVGMAQLWSEHSDTIVATDPPMKQVLPVLARLGSLFGSKPPEPTP